jgi:hypothetical protein
MIKAEELYYPTAEEARDIDWEETGEDVSWAYWEGQVRRTRTLVWSNDDGEWSVHEKRTGTQLDRELLDEPEQPEGPMMNYWWPLGHDLRLGDPRNTAAVIAGLNTCVVEVDGVYGIALTGGGMDLSWDLALSAVLAGYYPWSGLGLRQGSPSSTWRYGVGEIGSAGARRVRAAMRHRLKADRRRIEAQMADVREWK